MYTSLLLHMQIDVVGQFDRTYPIAVTVFKGTKLTGARLV